MNAFILPFEKIGARDIALVGGKGANLGELTRAGFNTPRGFCITTEAFHSFISEAEKEIYSQLGKVSADNLEQLREIGNSVRKTLERLPLPSEVEDAVETAWRKLGDLDAYAVRSSATAEDLPYASFAGQQDTYLNISGREALLSSVKACFISLFTDRAILYREQNGFDHHKVALAVVVQRMVQPDVAGILFTADPVSGNRKITSIDASFGLGEALVAGLVSADLYQVDEQSQQIIKRQIADKQISIRSLHEGGTEQIELDEARRNQAALTDEQVFKLAALGQKIETHYGIPQDIEWALKGDDIYITQSRPITSLYPLPEPRPKDDALHIYFSMSHFQVMTEPISPLGLSVLRTFLPLPRQANQIESEGVITAAGRFYADLSPLLRHPIGRRLLLKGMDSADQLAVNAIGELIKRPRFQSRRTRFNPLKLLLAVRPYVFKMFHMLLRGQPEGVNEDTLEFINGLVAETGKKLDAADNLQEKLVITIEELKDTAFPIFTWAPYMGSGMVARALLRRIMKKRGRIEDLDAIERGLSGNVVTDMGLAVGDLADAAQTSNELKTLLTQTKVDAQTRLAGAVNIEGGEAFLQEWNNFIDTYGARGPAEIDLGRPRWAEDPTSLLQMLVSTMNQSEPGAHRAHYQQLVDEAEQATATLLKEADKGWLGWLRGPIIKRLILVSRNLMPLREHHKFYVIQMFLLFKFVLIEAGEKLADGKQLKNAEDVWYLTLPEIYEAFENPGKDLNDQVVERRAAYERYDKLTPARVITSDGEIPIARLAGVDAPEGALIGSPVSAGVIEGIAKVVLDPGVETLEPGEILVAPYTDPGWTPLFVNAAGLITEVGGLMTHGSLVAREYGIPAVVGVLDATTLIKTGQRVRVYGEAGYIELLDEKEKIEASTL